MNKKVQESRGIPPVRTWVVKFWKDGKVFHVEEVDTINKKFAYWMANEQSGYKSQESDKVTVVLSNRPTYLKRNVKESTLKHKGLPTKKSKKIKECSMKKEKRLMFEFINNICEKKYSSAKTNLVNIVDEKIKGKIRDISKKSA